MKCSKSSWKNVTSLLGISDPWSLQWWRNIFNGIKSMYREHIHFQHKGMQDAAKSDRHFPVHRRYIIYHQRSPPPGSYSFLLLLLSRRYRSLESHSPDFETSAFLQISDSWRNLLNPTMDMFSNSVFLFCPFFSCNLFLIIAAVSKMINSSTDEAE